MTCIYHIMFRVEEEKKKMWLEDKPCRAMKEKIYLKENWSGDLPGLAPIGKCYFDYSKECTEECSQYISVKEG